MPSSSLFFRQRYFQGFIVLSQMGDMLAKPESQKFSTVFETSHLRVGCCSMQGWRKTMEDAFIAQLNLDNNKSRAFFGVFDGHQSDEASRYCREFLLQKFTSALDSHGDNYTEAFEETFNAIDEQICQKYSSSGTVANCIYISDKKIVCANAGDSRSVLCRNGTPVPLSFDHKPFHPGEQARIQHAGCHVENGRINMALAVSRALGDVDFKSNEALSWKEQAVTALPDVLVFDTSDQDNFIVMGCDGIWDVLSNEECCEFIRERLYPANAGEKVDIGLVCEQVLDRCLATSNTVREGTDNMTLIVVQFKPPFFE